MNQHDVHSTWLIPFLSFLPFLPRNDSNMNKKTYHSRHDKNLSCRLCLCPCPCPYFRPSTMTNYECLIRSLFYTNCSILFHTALISSCNSFIVLLLNIAFEPPSSSSGKSGNFFEKFLDNIPFYSRSSFNVFIVNLHSINH
jgi:hypothetical protein